VSSLVRQYKCYFRKTSQVSEIIYHRENLFLCKKSSRLLELFLYVHFFTTDLIFVSLTARDFSRKFKRRYARRRSKPALSARSV